MPQNINSQNHQTNTSHTDRSGIHSQLLVSRSTQPFFLSVSKYQLWLEWKACIVCVYIRVGKYR